MRTFNRWLENINNNALVNALRQLANEINQFQMHDMSNGDAYPVLSNDWKSSGAVIAAKQHASLSPNAEQEFKNLSNVSVWTRPDVFQKSKSICLQQIEKVIQACQEEHNPYAGRRNPFDDDDE
jgi:hypothetical protein